MGIKMPKISGEFRRFSHGRFREARHPSSRSTPFTPHPALSLQHASPRMSVTSVRRLAPPLEGKLPVGATSLCSLSCPRHIEKDLTHWLDEPRTWKEYFDQRLTSPGATEICWPRSEGRKEKPGGSLSAPSSQDSAASGVSKRLGGTAVWHPAVWTTSLRCGTERAEATRPESGPHGPEQWSPLSGDLSDQEH